jgi:predicted ATPase with chaperone activity
MTDKIDAGGTTSPGAALGRDGGRAFDSEGVASASGDSFFPPVPTTFEETGISQSIVEDLILKELLARGDLSGRDLAQALYLPFSCVKDILPSLKSRMLLGQKSSTGIGDFVYHLSDQGHAKALAARDASAYTGPAPVCFADYLASVEGQSIRRESPDEMSVRQALSDLVLASEVLDAIGPAVNSARGLFLYGAPGNGKTALAERISKCFGDSIYVPRTVVVEGVLIRLFDAQYHRVVVPQEKALVPAYDQRWVRVERPVVVVGGELTMEQLEVRYNQVLRVSEAPLQLKANCGIFLIDDFGRQRVHHEALLNRWIVPLEKRIDFLSLPNGRTVAVPFDELIIFSTNLEPAELVDDAFLRRIPYKVHVEDPSEEQFRQLMRMAASGAGVRYEEAAVNYLIDRHYRGKRPFRACQPRDLMAQVVNACKYRRIEPRMNRSLIDNACRNYFSAMGASEEPPRESPPAVEPIAPLPLRGGGGEESRRRERAFYAPGTRGRDDR